MRVCVCKCWSVHVGEAMRSVGLSVMVYRGMYGCL